MRNQLIAMSIKWWLAVIVILTGLPFAALGGDSASLNEQLIEAAERGDMPSITTFLAKGANVNSRDKHGWTPLMWATSYDRANAVRLLLEKGADVNSKGKAGETALTQASGFGYTEVMTVLLDSGADVNAQDERGWSALRHAAAERHTDAVNLLKARGAKVTLIIAAILGDMEEAQRLIRSGADLDEKDEDGCTPLIEAIRHENVQVVKLLLDRGADPNETDNEDNTALMMAGLTGQLDVVKLLLAGGADLNARNIKGWTALSYTGAEQGAVRRFLEAAGAVDERTDSGAGVPTVAPSTKKRKDKLLTG
jgi:ankyrin repeat protein